MPGLWFLDRLSCGFQNEICKSKSNSPELFECDPQITSNLCDLEERFHAGIWYSSRELTSPSFCTTVNERVYITAVDGEPRIGGTKGLQATGAGGL